MTMQVRAGDTSSEGYEALPLVLLVIRQELHPMWSMWSQCTPMCWGHYRGAIRKSR